MSTAIKLTLISILACVCQTTLVDFVRVAGIAPDMLIVFLVLLTSYVGAYGGFCAGALTAMFYDASVGYVLAINLVGYTFIGWASPMLRNFLDLTLKKMKHKSILVMMLICAFLTLVREILYIGYLFLIGSDQSLITIVRAVLCCAYSAFMILPCSFIVRKIMKAHISVKKKHEDLDEEKLPE